MEGDLKFYTRGEEVANAVTHGIGAGLSVAALVLLIVFAENKGDKWYVLSYTIYGISLLLLYLESTLYHSITNMKVKKLFRIFDHASIYLLIAGTYTPFTLTVLRPTVGWIIFGIVWTLAIAGIIMKVFWIGRFNVISTLIYIGMGWIIIFAMKRLMMLLPTAGIVLLFAGGIIYTAGAVLYLIDRIPYNHAIWHLFVMGGSICHFLCILLYLFPAK
ncbi:MAG: hemolysin III family protein [Clostridium sp.]|uniref:PAQR family membrane homeostasis protein TrhA n=1 Tax=Clostridium sp. TaxID=1506 RepID=UPI0025BF3C35|nr:hemolysin III family protein [Clostridium sp.]MCH3962900.1 hemolysin III family protein [Clostridium sp.]MCI1715685.1 hemolysin III family protein [Clostridium sp.]MCI1800110.1 hemolysin III family protein [Clostridium sp.]MCI1814024.1 hemolysin III family protein [Clostridium sp.]MCI1870922.1 hemolysin III family protein [Clostridium sp.]